MLNIKGCIVISGAMGCQKEIVHKIIQDKKPSYVLVVKDNQKNLHEHIFETEKMLQTSCTYKEIDADHGRIEERHYEIYRDLSFVNAAWNWENLSALVVVESRRYDKKKQFQSEQKRCYITNLPRGKSQTIAQAIRSHWSAESMHWTMDVVFGEDAGRKRRWNAEENLSLLIKVVMSLLRNHKKKIGGGQIHGKDEKTSCMEHERIRGNSL